MKVKFNKFERVAGLFVIGAILGFLGSLVSVAAKQGWFDTKIYYSTIFDNAEGVHPGTHVQISGLKAGSVEEVDINTENKIIVKFFVFSKFEEKVRKDSIATLIRPFVIGERVLDISPGSIKEEKVLANAQIPVIESLDLMTLLSGKHLGNYLSSMSEMMNNFKNLAEAFLDKNRTKSFIEMFDKIEPLVRNLNSMSIEVIKLSKQVNKDEKLGVVLGDLSKLTKEINNMMPELKEKMPQLSSDLSTLVSNLAELTTQFKTIIPAIAEISPDLPRVSKRAVEALDESVVLMKALQKSFMLKGNVEDVRDEEKKRQPAEKK